MIKSIIILIVMVLVNLALVFAIIRLVKRTDENLQKFFLEKSSEIFPEQKNKIIETNDAEESKEVIEKPEPQYIVNNIDKASYKNSEFKQNYKNVKEEMNFDKTDVILDVMYSSEKQNDSQCEALRRINESFDFETIYELSTVTVDKQLDILNSVFDAKQKEFLENYLRSIGNKKFDIATFFNYVKEQAKLIDENFYIKTGSADDSFDDLGENVITVHDDNIVEGIKVVHKNKMYDYSI